MQDDWINTFERALQKYASGRRQYQAWKVADASGWPFPAGEFYVVHGHLWAAASPQKQTRREKQSRLPVTPDDLAELDNAIKALAKAMGRIERRSGMMTHMKALISEMALRVKPAPQIAAMPHIAEALGIYRALLGGATSGLRFLDPKQTQSSNLAALALFLKARGWKFTMRGLTECVWAAAEASGSNWAPSPEAIEKRIREYRRNHEQDFDWLTAQVQGRDHSELYLQLYGLRLSGAKQKPTQVH